MNIYKERMIRAVIVNLLCISMIIATAKPISMDRSFSIDLNRNNTVTNFNMEYPVAGVTAVLLAEMMTNFTNESNIEKYDVATVRSGIVVEAIPDVESETSENIELYSSNTVEEATVIEEPLYEEIDNYTAYVNADSGLRVRSSSEIVDDNIIGKLSWNSAVEVIGKKDDWVVISYNDSIGFISSEFIQTESIEESTYNHTWTGEVLNSTNGRVDGPNGAETYYNLPMSGVVSLMNSNGYYGTTWTRSDGAKMWNSYVMIAADLSKYPKGTIVETTLGMGIVVDTGGFVTNGSGVAFDIATNW